MASKAGPHHLMVASEGKEIGGVVDGAARRRAADAQGRVVVVANVAEFDRPQEMGPGGLMKDSVSGRVGPV